VGLISSVSVRFTNPARLPGRPWSRCRQDALTAAGSGGVVLVESGLHIEESVVVIDAPVSIIDEEGP